MLKELSTAGAAADAVAAILKGRGTPSARLIELTNSDDPSVRLTAARAMAQIAPTDPRGLPVLKAVLAATTSADGGDPTMMMATSPLLGPSWSSEQPSVRWLGKTLADEEAPAMVRARAAETLAGIKEDTLPAIPFMIKAISSKDTYVSRQASLAIKQIGPKALPAVRDAIQAESDERAPRTTGVDPVGPRRRGRRAFKELSHGDEAEALWWSAVIGQSGATVTPWYESAAREALIKCGQPVERWSTRQSRNAPWAGRPKVEQPIGWYLKVLVDADAPRSLRRDAGTAARLRADQNRRTANDAASPLGRD